MQCISLSSLTSWWNYSELTDLIIDATGTTELGVLVALELKNIIDNILTDKIKCYRNSQFDLKFEISKWLIISPIREYFQQFAIGSIRLICRHGSSKTQIWLDGEKILQKNFFGQVWIDFDRFTTSRNASKRSTKNGRIPLFTGSILYFIGSIAIP